MAVIVTDNNSSIKLQYDCGLDEDGHDIIKRNTLSKVKHDATNEDIFAITESIGKLQKYTIREVVRQDNKVLG